MRTERRGERVQQDSRVEVHEEEEEEEEEPPRLWFSCGNGVQKAPATSGLSSPKQYRCAFWESGGSIPTADLKYS